MALGHISPFLHVFSVSPVEVLAFAQAPSEQPWGEWVWELLYLLHPAQGFRPGSRLPE